MNDKWKRLTTKSEKLVISDDFIIDVTGLSFTEFGNALKFYEAKDNIGAANYILSTTLRKTIPITDMSDEELAVFVGTLDTEVAAKIINTVQKMSGFNSKEDDGKNQ